MDRKNFINTVSGVVAGVVLPFPAALARENRVGMPYKKPSYLKPGDTIGITSPAGAITVEEMQPALAVLKSWGFNLKIGTAIGKKDFTRGGTDEERRADLQAMLDDSEVKAILCARGGYGVVRIVDALDWTRFRLKPKWVIGFSDITILHSHIHRHCQVASLHSKMTNSFPDDWNKALPIQVETILSLRDALQGRRMQYSAPPHPQNKTGSAEGPLVGGNLKLLESMAGTPSDINTTGKILFVEDTGEYLYSLDRMFWNLKRTGKLDKLAALIIGGFSIKEDDEGEEFGRTLQEIVLEKVKGFNYPVCFEFPVGHQRANYALKCGVVHRLAVQAHEVTLTEKI
jgi:muramoyltetrapeptide carboxypeptidase